MAARRDAAQRRALKEAVTRHVQEYGRVDWYRLRAQCPDVSRRTLQRLAKEVTEGAVGARDRSVARLKHAVEQTEAPALAAVPQFRRGDS